MAMVVKANKDIPGIGGHISTYASAATLYEVGLQPFSTRQRFSAGRRPHLFPRACHSGNLRARLFRGPTSEEMLHHFRREITSEGKGLSSYPHPWLMPDYWEFPTVSMGLGPIMSIYQARFNRYLQDRGLKDRATSVWAFVGDGETDEPESLAL